MKAIWSRIDAWLDASAPAVRRSLREGLGESAIASLETFLEVELPADMVASLRVHDGQRAEANLLPGYRLLSSADIMEEWATWCQLLDDGVFPHRGEASGGIRDDWWNKRWIPVASDDAGNLYCVDVAPGSDGRHGQIITVWHDSAERERVAPSFRELLLELANGLAAGTLVYSVEDAGIVHATAIDASAGDPAYFMAAAIAVARPVEDPKLVLTVKKTVASSLTKIRTGFQQGRNHPIVEVDFHELDQASRVDAVNGLCELLALLDDARVEPVTYAMNRNELFSFQNSDDKHHWVVPRAKFLQVIAEAARF